MLGCVAVSPKASYASQTRQCRVKSMGFVSDRCRFKRGKSKHFNTIKYLIIWSLRTWNSILFSDAAESKLVYWENFEKAFQENPEAIKSALLISYLRKSFPTRIYVDQHGNRYSWDRNRGFVPVNQYTRPAIPGYHQTPVYTNYQNHVPSYQIPPAPVFWAQSPQGWIPISSDPFFTAYTSYPFNVNKYWCDPTVTDFNNVIPQLSTEVSGKCARMMMKKVVVCTNTQSKLEKSYMIEI